MAWLTGWTYRKSITLSRASGAVTNYQMKLLIGESSGASGEDVDCGGHCLSSFNDLRFTASDGETTLDYWIESISGTTPNQLATVWIEFNSIGTSDTTFYMYYGNGGASAYSNGPDTFKFFDDFSEDLSKWSGDTSSAFISGGICTITAGAAGAKTIYSSAYSGDIALRARANLANVDYSQLLLCPNPLDNNYIDIYHNSADPNHSTHVTSKSGTSTTISNVDIGFGSYHIYDITRSLTGTDTARTFTDNVQNDGGSTSNVPIVDLCAAMRSQSNYATVSCDWILIRQYIETEPAWGAWGSQEEDINVTIAPPPLEVTASLSCGEIVEWPVLLTIDPLQVTAELSGAPQISIPAALEVTAGLDVSAISCGFFIAPDPLEVTAGLTASLAHSIPAPALEVTAGLTAKTLIGLPAVLGVTANLAAPGVIVIQSDEYIITYLCYLTPQAGSIYPAITLPMSSFQGRFKSGDPSFLSVVVPGDDYATDISNRIDTVNPPELAVYMRKTFPDGNAITEKIMGVDLEDITIDEGSSSYSITLSGHRTTTYSGKAVTLTGASYKNVTGGKTRYRCSPDLYLRPGDTVTVNGDTFTADNISIAMSAESQTMEVAEA